jgi:manganese peroxidase
LIIPFYSSNTSASGEVGSSVRGTLRLQSDKVLSQASETACDWQDFAVNPSKMSTEFGNAMVKLSLLGHNQNSLIDCSDVIPAAKPFKGQPFFPPTLTNKDVQQACATAAFPKLSTAPGPAESVAPMYVSFFDLD